MNKYGICCLISVSVKLIFSNFKLGVIPALSSMTFGRFNQSSQQAFHPFKNQTSKENRIGIVYLKFIISATSLFVHQIFNINWKSSSLKINFLRVASIQSLWSDFWIKVNISTALTALAQYLTMNTLVIWFTLLRITANFIWTSISK